MRPGLFPESVRRLRLARAAGWAALLLAAAGCQSLRPGPDTAPRAARPPIRDADNPFVLTATSGAAPTDPPAAARSTLRLAVLHVQVPRARRSEAQQVWNHLREDMLDSELLLRLRRNGLRVGLGRAAGWEAIRAVLEAIPGRVVSYRQTVRLPAAFPLGLELDSGPRDQTLFFVGPDGVLSGATWPQSRNVLLVTWAADLRRQDLVHLFVAPEVRQRRPGWRWVRTAAGLWQSPRQDGRVFRAAQFSLALEPGEFVMLAPSRQAEVFGIIGGALLVRDQHGRRYDSYIFLRPELNHVGRSD